MMLPKRTIGRELVPISSRHSLEGAEPTWWVEFDAVDVHGRRRQWLSSAARIGKRDDDRDCQCETSAPLSTTMLFCIQHRLFHHDNLIIPGRMPFPTMPIFISCRALSCKHRKC